MLTRTPSVLEIVNIGTPSQSVRVIVDTGSYDFWVNPTCAESSEELLCEINGHYNPDVSSSSSSLESDMDILYGSANVQGAYYLDSVKIAGMYGLQPLLHCMASSL